MKLKVKHKSRRHKIIDQNKKPAAFWAAGTIVKTGARLILVNISMRIILIVVVFFASIKKY